MSRSTRSTRFTHKFFFTFMIYYKSTPLNDAVDSVTLFHRLDCVWAKCIALIRTSRRPKKSERPSRRYNAIGLMYLQARLRLSKLSNENIMWLPLLTSGKKNKHLHTGTALYKTFSLDLKLMMGLTH